MKKILLLLLCICTLSPLVLIAERQEVKVGVIIPLTGGAVRRGADGLNAIKLWEQKVNRLPGKYTYKFIVEDGQCGVGSAATTAGKKLIHIDKVKFLIAGCSGEVLQNATTVEREKILLFAIGANHSDIRKAGDYIFRTFIDVESAIKGFAKHISSSLDSKIALLNEENSFTAGIEKQFMQHLEDRIVESESFPPGTSDFRSVLLKLKKHKVSGIYLNTISEDTAIAIVNQAKVLGLNMKFYSYLFPEMPWFKKAIGANGAGIEFIGFPYSKDSSPEFQEFMKDYMKVHPEGPALSFLLHSTFDALTSVSDCINLTGPEPTAVKECLYRYKEPGSSGLIEYDTNGDIKNINYVLKRLLADGSSEVIVDLNS